MRFEVHFSVGSLYAQDWLERETCLFSKSRSSFFQAVGAVDPFSRISAGRICAAPPVQPLQDVAVDVLAVLAASLGASTRLWLSESNLASEVD